MRGFFILSNPEPLEASVPEGPARGPRLKKKEKDEMEGHRCIMPAKKQEEGRTSARALSLGSGQGQWGGLRPSSQEQNETSPTPAHIWVQRPDQQQRHPRQRRGAAQNLEEGERNKSSPPPVPPYSEQLHPPGPVQGTCECLLGYFVTLSGRSPWNRLWASADSARGEAIFSFSELTRVSTHSGHGDAGDPCRLGPASLGTMTVRNGLAKERHTTAIRRVALCLCRRSLGGVPLAFSLL